jgi:hypothetical protein
VSSFAEQHQHDAAPVLRKNFDAALVPTYQNSKAFIE